MEIGGRLIVDANKQGVYNGHGGVLNRLSLMRYSDYMLSLILREWNQISEYMIAIF